MNKRVRRGFTLPEILVTVTVIAVLAAVVVPAVTQYAGSGDAPAVQANINALSTAATSYVADNRAYPTQLTDLAKYAGGLSFGGSTATVTTATTGTLSGSEGFGLQVRNVFATDHSINSAPYITISVVGSNKSCSALDTALDDGEKTTGRFQYDTEAASCATGYILLIPHTT
jgi:prepilin-type N-terminal cleavage/methylation domain-containing protein